MKRLKLGVIGLGAMGKHHVRVASTLPGVKLVGVADINSALAEAISQQFQVPFYTNYQDLLPNADAVCLATPTHTHFQIAQDCLSARRHLFIEKPFTGDSGAAAHLISLAKEKNLILEVNFIERFNPAYVKLLKLLKHEKIHGVDLQRLSPFPDRISDADVVFDMMIHDLDLFPLIVQSEIQSIKAKGEKIRSNKFDRVIAIFTHASGIITRVEANRVFGSKSRKITVTTEKHLIEADLLMKRIYIRDFSSPVPTTIPINEKDQLTEILSDFVAAIKKKKAPAVTAEDGLKALRLADEVEKACS